MRRAPGSLSLAECAEVRRLHQRGLSAEEIAAALVLPVATVAVLAALLAGASDEEARKAASDAALLPEQVDEVRRLRGIGWSVASIARRLDLEPAVVARRLGVVWGRG